MSYDELQVQQRVVRPLLVAWVPLAGVMLILVLLEIWLPTGKSPVTHFFTHRENIASEEWKATSLAGCDLVAAQVVLVDTDNRIFFGLLRYRLCPCWVVTERELQACRNAPADSYDAVVVYRSGRLRIEGDIAK